ncbi:hypothetical protein ACF073_23300 [Streptomyces sp. NPDC015171]|uniref:hypothetical protein n=1 Tax=Streptomyces sp. NPDC015171 TaxID=3364945 RepID=UPI003701860D
MSSAAPRHEVIPSPDALRLARDGVVVAELLDPDEARWLQEEARNVRQGFMDSKRRAAFEEFLARQASLDGQ